VFALEFIERGHPICSDVRETPVQGSQPFLIERWTVNVGCESKIIEQISGLPFREAIDQPVEFFLHGHNSIVACPAESVRS
jgi:hypothetical protein